MVHSSQHDPRPSQRDPGLSSLISPLENLRLTSLVSTPFPIQELPLELILNITDFLDPPARNALRMVCRLFHSTVPNTSKSQMCRICQAEFKQLIQRDRYIKYCQMEQDGLLSNRLVCSKCLKPHDICFFSEPQKSQSSGKRACLGMQGYLEYCPHRMLSLSQLRALAYRPDGSLRDIWIRRALCQQCSSSRPVSENMVARRVELIKASSQASSSGTQKVYASLIREHAVMKFCETKVLYETNIAEALSALDLWICPHMKTCDLITHLGTYIDREAAGYESCNTAEEFLRGLGPPNITARPVTSFPLPPIITQDPLFTGSCNDSDCTTEVKLYLGNGLGSRVFQIKVRTATSLGPLHDANAPRWLGRLMLPKEIKIRKN